MWAKRHGKKHGEKSTFLRALICKERTGVWDESVFALEDKDDD